MAKPSVIRQLKSDPKVTRWERDGVRYAFTGIQPATFVEADWDVLPATNAQEFEALKFPPEPVSDSVKALFSRFQ